MKTELLDAVESKNLKKDTPHFEIGDIVDYGQSRYNKTVFSSLLRGIFPDCALSAFGQICPCKIAITGNCC